MQKGRQSFFLKNPVYIRSSYTIVGPKEGKSNFAEYFDTILKDDLWGEKSYEKAESKMHRETIRGAVCKGGLDFEEVDLMLAGDLLNEISASNLAMRYFQVPFAGLYNACATYSESMLIGASLIDAGIVRTVACSTSSHFASVERQYRYPLELGNQRTPTSQWTVTGAGCTVLTAKRPTRAQDETAKEEFTEKLRKAQCASLENCVPDNKTPTGFVERLKRKAARVFGKTRSDNAECELTCDPNYERTHVARITGGTFGKVVDLGIEDESNMGAVMAPAAADTLMAHLTDTGRTPEDYDMIITGDLGRFGRDALLYLLGKEGIRLPSTYLDCGAEYFKPEQETFQGGSGAGCVNTAFNACFLKRLERGELNRILVLATGALLNKDTPLQKETIPGICHAFVVENEPIKP